MTRAERAAQRAAGRRARGGVVFGFAAGVVVGVLLAPKSGREIREQVFGSAGVGGHVTRLRGALGVGGDPADQNEALRRKIEETRERLRRQMDEDGDAAAGETAGDAPAG